MSHETIGIKTPFRDRIIENNFEVGVIPIKPYVDFTKDVNDSNFCTIGFRLRYLVSLLHLPKVQAILDTFGKNVYNSIKGFFP